MAAPTSHQSASLYCGDLNPDVTEAMLFELFKAVGPVLSIRVCRDAVTRQSLGYAYVNFQSATDAERALETLNYHQIKGRPIRIMWSHRDPGLRKAGAGNIFIKNLHKSIDNQTLYDTFSQFGNILSCKVATDHSGESRGYGFVHFESEDSAKAAIEKVNGMLLKSMQVFVGQFVRHTARQQQSLSAFTNVYIKDLKANVTEAQVSAYFSQFGKIKSMCLKTDGKGRPFSFVDFEKHEEALEAVEKGPEGTHDLTDEGRRLFVGRAQRKSERLEELKRKFSQMKSRWNEYTGSNLFVKNLDDTITDKELREAFGRFGEITSSKVMMDEKVPNLSKGFGFVCFKETESANKAINEMNGFILGTKPLYVNVAQRREVRRATLEIQYAARVARSAPSQGQMMGYNAMYPPAPYFPQAAGGYPYGMVGPAGGRGGMIGAPKWGQMPFPQMPATQPIGMRVAQPPVRGGRGVVAGRGPQNVAARGAPMGRGPMPGRVAAQPQGVQYTKQARNKEAGLPATGATPATGGLMGAGSEQLSPAALAQMTPEEQKNALGERLFARISVLQPMFASKITGMLLEMDVPETLNLLESPEILHAKIEEAMEVLKAHEGDIH